MKNNKKVDVIFKIVVMLYLWVIAYAYMRLMGTAPDGESDKALFITIASIVSAIVGCILLYLFKKYATKYINKSDN